MANLSGIIKAIRNYMRQDRGINGDAQRLEQLGWMLFLKIFDDKEKELELEDNYRSPIPDRLKWRRWAGDNEGKTGDPLLEFVDNDLFPTLRNLTPTEDDPRIFVLREIFAGNNNYMKSGTVMKQVINKINEIDFNRSKDKQVFGRIYEELLRELQSAGKSGEFYTPRGVTQFMTDTINPRLGESLLDPACGTGGFLTAAIENMRKEATGVQDLKTIERNVRGVEVKPLPYMLAVTNLILHDIENPSISEEDTLSREITTIRERDRVDVILANPPFGGVVSEGMENNVPQKYRTKESADLFLLYIIRYLKEGGRAAIVLPDGSLTGEGVKARIREKLLTSCNLHTIIRLPNSVFKPYATVATNLLFFTKGEPTKEIWYYEHQLPDGQKSYSKTKAIEVEEFDPIKDWWNHRTEHEQAWRVDVQKVIENGYDLDVKNPNGKQEEVVESAAAILKRISNRQSTINDLLKGITESLEQEEVNLHEI